MTHDQKLAITEVPQTGILPAPKNCIEKMIKYTRIVYTTHPDLQAHERVCFVKAVQKISKVTYPSKGIYGDCVCLRALRCLVVTGVGFLSGSSQLSHLEYQSTNLQDPRVTPHTHTVEMYLFNLNIWEQGDGATLLSSTAKKTRVTIKRMQKFFSDC